MNIISKKNHFSFPAYLSVALGLFVAAFFVVDSAKAINSYFYLFIGCPVIVFIFRKGLGPLGSIGQNLPTLALGLHVLIVFLTELGSPDAGFSYLKTCLYLAVLWLALEIACRDEFATARLWRCLAVCSALVALYAMAEWLLAYAAHGQFIRVSLYAAASNPVHASFLILIGWLGYWFKYGLPGAMQYGKAGFLAALILVVTFTFCVCIVFQSRSGLVGSSAALLAWLVSSKHRRFAAAVLALVAIGIWISGLYEPLLQRGDSYRLEIWIDALRHLFRECPVLTGCPDDENYLFAGQFEHPHSAYFSILVDSGLLGAASFGIFTLIYFGAGLRKNAAWFQASLVGWLGVLTTSNGLVDSPRPLWVYFWTPTFLALIEMKRPNVQKLDDSNETSSTTVRHGA